MRLADKLQEWLNYSEWDDKIELDEETQTSSLNFTYGINDQAFNVYIQTDEAKDFMKFYFYAPFNALSKKHTDCALLFNRLNAQSYCGTITVSDKGRIRWHHTVDFEDTDPSVKAINNAFLYGSDVIEQAFDEISEIALTKTTAQELFNRLDAEAEAESSEEDVPDSI